MFNSSSWAVLRRAMNTTHNRTLRREEELVFIEEINAYSVHFVHGKEYKVQNIMTNHQQPVKTDNEE